MPDLLLQPLEMLSATNGNIDGIHVNGGYHKARKMVNLSGMITEGKSVSHPEMGSLFVRLVVCHGHFNSARHDNDSHFGSSTIPHQHAFLPGQLNLVFRLCADITNLSTISTRFPKCSVQENQ